MLGCLDCRGWRSARMGGKGCMWMRMQSKCYMNKRQKGRRCCLHGISFGRLRKYARPIFAVNVNVKSLPRIVVLLILLIQSLHGFLRISLLASSSCCFPPCPSHSSTYQSSRLLAARDALKRYSQRGTSDNNVLRGSFLSPQKNLSSRNDNLSDLT